jgi:hypothetical protein
MEAEEDCASRKAIYNKRNLRMTVAGISGGKHFCPAKAVSGSSGTIWQTEEKLRKCGCHGMWVAVAIYAKYQPVLEEYGLPAEISERL